jgi:hypothetical protein
MSYAASVVKSNQTAAGTIPTDGSTTYVDVTISAVDTAKVMVIHERAGPGGYGGSNNPFPTYGASVTSTTNVRLFITHTLTSGHACTLQARILEYY